MRLRPWQLSLAAVLICVIALVVTLRYRNASFLGHERLFTSLPTDHAIIFGADVAALRKAGLLTLLAGPKGGEELEYRRFVDQTGFDYRSDLDYVAASISATGGSRYFVFDGRFDWAAMYGVARRSGGHCQNAFCDLPGYSNGRNFSFLPLGPNTLGMAVSAGPQAAWALAQTNPGVPMPSVPAYPLFMAMDADVLVSGDSFPASLRPVSETLSAADYVVLGLLAGNGGSIQLALDADCMSTERAENLKIQLERLLGASSPVSTLLHDGSIHIKDRAIRGRWTVDQRALQAFTTP